MKHIVFLTGSYYPNYSAVGYCAYQVQKCLIDEFAVSVVSVRDSLGQPLEEAYEGSRIQRIETPYTKWRNILKSGSGPFARWGFSMLRVWGAVRRLMAPETVDRALVRAYFERLVSMDPKPDVIVPVVFPIETIIAALAYHKLHAEVRVFPYLFDNFVENGAIHVLNIARRLKRNRHLQLERKMLEEADAVLSMHPLRQHYELNFDKALLDKITFLEHPLLVPLPEMARRPKDSIARLCFTGSLVRNVAEADYLLELLRAIRIETKVEADFYVMGNAADRVKTETIGNRISIVNHGRVPKSQANAAVQNADILLNIGETQGKQVSSKIFEYMSCGKPIVHLAYVKDDVVSKILAKYPLALCLEQDRSRFDENQSRLGEFIEENRFHMLSFDEVRAIYPEAMPATTAAIFSNLINTVPS